LIWYNIASWFKPEYYDYKFIIINFFILFFYLIIISKYIFLSKTIYFCKKARPTLLVQTNKTFEVKGNLKKQTQASTNPTKLIPTWMTVANLVYLKVY